MDQDEQAKIWPKTKCTWSAQGANRSSFDYASRDKTAGGFAQDDRILIYYQPFTGILFVDTA
jgi:hypothetical protein